MSLCSDLDNEVFDEQHLKEVFKKVLHYAETDVPIEEVEDLRWMAERGAKELEALLNKLPEQKRIAITFLLAAGTCELVMALVMMAEQFSSPQCPPRFV